MEDKKLTVDEIKDYLLEKIEHYNHMQSLEKDGSWLDGYYFGMRQSAVLIFAAILLDHFPEVEK